MANETDSVAIEAAAAPTAEPGRSYPEPFATRVAGRVRRPLGDFFGLTNFGVNLTRLPVVSQFECNSPPIDKSGLMWHKIAILTPQQENSAPLIMRRP